MIFECWEDDEGLSLFPAGQDPVGQHSCLPDATLVYTIEARTWEEAMQKHYDRQESLPRGREIVLRLNGQRWGAYDPMDKT